MRPKSITWLIGVFLLGAICATSLVARERAVIDGEYILMLQEGASPDALLEKLPGENNLTGQELLSKRLNIWRFSFNPDVSSSHQLLDLFHGVEEVKIVQRNHHISQRDTVPNDPLFSQQWGLQNTGQSGGSIGADIAADSAWERTTGGVTAAGDTIVVAVIDGGFDLQHIDLNFWENKNEIPANGIDDDLNGYIDDFQGWDALSNDGNLPPGQHGTHVAGIAGAIGNNDTGVTGVNWNVQVLPIAGSSADEATVIEAYGYALEMRALYNATNGQQGAFVVATNSSFGIDFGQPANHPIWCAFYDSLGSYGILNTGATINKSRNIDTIGDVPTGCSSDWLISVTNTTKQDLLNNDAGFGASTIDLGAPGTNIFSTVPNNQYAGLTGTSMATPHVTGAVALMYSLDCQNLIEAYQTAPASFALLLKNVLLATADSLPSLANITVSGGRLNMQQALDSLEALFCQNCADVSINKTNPSCYEAQDGSASVTIPADTASRFQVHWSNDSSGRAISSLDKGHYQLTITDTAGCSQTFFMALGSPDSLSSTIYTMNASNQLTTDGEASVIISGGTPPYNYQWEHTNQDTPTLSNLVPGEYMVTVRDSNGCALIDTVVIEGRQTGIQNNNQNSSALSIEPNPAQKQIILRSTLLQSATAITIINASGQQVLLHEFAPCNTSSSKGCHQQLNVSNLASGLYFLQIRNKDGRHLSEKFMVR